MLLEEIKKECKIELNEEKQGEELYFENKPDIKIINELKENGYLWHNIKKCWYRKLEYKNTKQLKAQKQTQNKLGIQIGDIFYFSWGYEESNINYFQVVNEKGTTQVIIREIKSEIVETLGYESYNVKPCKNKFLDKSQFIIDNKIGAVKKVNGSLDGTKYINIDSFGFCTLWNGKENLMTCYY